MFVFLVLDGWGELYRVGKVEECTRRIRYSITVEMYSIACAAAVSSRERQHFENSNLEIL